MSKSPAYQRYPKDYMSDGNVLRMTFEQRGIYDWLLDSCWLEDGIPADVGELARVCQIPARRMEAAWTRISPCFEAHPRKEGWLTNGRLEREREVQRLWIEKSARGGRRSAEVRKGGSRLVEPPLQPKGNTPFAVRSSQSATVLQHTVGSGKKKRRPIPTYSAEFLELWKIHHHGPKAEAFTEYTGALDRGVSHETLLRGLRAYVKAKVRPDFDGVHLFRWLRDSRWEEYAEQAGGTKPAWTPVITERPHHTHDSGPRLVPSDGMKPAAGLAATILANVPRPTENRPA